MSDTGWMILVLLAGYVVVIVGYLAYRRWKDWPRCSYCHKRLGRKDHGWYHRKCRKLIESRKHQFAWPEHDFTKIKFQ